MERAVWSFYNWWRDIIRSGEIWRELFGAFIIGQGSRDAYSNQLYLRRDIIKSGEIWRELLKDIISVEIYGESCLELL